MRSLVDLGFARRMSIVELWHALAASKGPNPGKTTLSSIRRLSASPGSILGRPLLPPCLHNAFWLVSGLALFLDCVRLFCHRSALRRAVGLGWGSGGSVDHGNNHCSSPFGAEDFQNTLPQSCLCDCAVPRQVLVSRRNIPPRQNKFSLSNSGRC